MVFSMGDSGRLGFRHFRFPGRFHLLRPDQFTDTTLALNFGFGRSTERMGADGQFLRQLAITENLDQGAAAIGQTRFAHRLDIHTRAIFKLIKRLQIYGKITRAKTGIVKTAFGNAPNERHLSALKSNANRTARAGRLALATPTAGFAVSAGFALAQAFAPVLGTGARF